MMLFQNKYRIESTRLPSWDYGRAGYYYITICTKNRQLFLGTVVEDDVSLSKIGEIVADEWVNTAQIRPNVELDEWIVMPNHLHLILVITYKITSTRREVSQQKIATSKASQTWAANTLGSIIGQFKGKCTKRIWAIGHTEFAWQPRFYDRIIRTEDTLNKARQYIAVNPVNWKKDRDNLSGLYM
ncbi:MAG: transposase [Candidatus Promineifilaceae bacterium]